MRYRVVIVPRAKQQMLDQALWWSEHRSAEQAFDWLIGLEKKLKELSHHPERHRPARENQEFERELHELYHGLGKKVTHRAVFEIRDDKVIVHSVRHLAQADLTAEDL